MCKNEDMIGLSGTETAEMRRGIVGALHEVHPDLSEPALDDLTRFGSRSLIVRPWDSMHVEYRRERYGREVLVGVRWYVRWLGPEAWAEAKERFEASNPPAGYFLDRARFVLSRASAAPDADPMALARWAEAAKGRDQRTGGVLVTRNGAIVAEWLQRPATATDPGEAWVAYEDMRRIVGECWVHALDMAQAQIKRALGEPVVALSAGELTMGHAPRKNGDAA